MSRRRRPATAEDAFDPEFDDPNADDADFDDRNVDNADFEDADFDDADLDDAEAGGATEAGGSRRARADGRRATAWRARAGGTGNRAAAMVRTGLNRIGEPPAGAGPPRPSRMEPPEDLVGYGIAALLVVIGVLFATVHGPGSPAHPDNIVPLAGVAVALALVAVIRLGNRFATAMTAVVAALLVETAKPPTELVILFYVSLVVPLGYAFWLTRRQSKAARAIAATQPHLSPEQRKAQREQRKAQKRGEAPPPPVRATPSRNRRYTPPQPARPKRTRKEIAAEAAVAASKRSGGSRRSKDAPGKDAPTSAGAGGSASTATSGAKRRIGRRSSD